jgi:hypothetical protein
VSKTAKPQSKPQLTEEVLLHGDSINFTAARVSDKPGRIRITSAYLTDYKTAEPEDKLMVRYNASHQIELGQSPRRQPRVAMTEL